MAVETGKIGSLTLICEFCGREIEVEYQDCPALTEGRCRLWASIATAAVWAVVNPGLHPPEDRRCDRQTTPGGADLPAPKRAVPALIDLFYF